MKKFFVIAPSIALSLIAGMLIYGANSDTQVVAPPVGDIKNEGLLNFTNRNRQEPLVLDERLNKSARAKCEDMVIKNYYSHIAPNSTDPWVFIQHEIGSPPSKYFYGENLNRFDGQPTAKDVVSSWMNSPKHRDAIANQSYHRVGFGVCHGGQSTLIVQHFVN